MNASTTDRIFSIRSASQLPHALTPSAKARSPLRKDWTTRGQDDGHDRDVRQHDEAGGEEPVGRELPEVDRTEEAVDRRRPQRVHLRLDLDELGQDGALRGERAVVHEHRDRLAEHRQQDDRGKQLLAHPVERVDERVDGALPRSAPTVPRAVRGSAPRRAGPPTPARRRAAARAHPRRAGCCSPARAGRRCPTAAAGDRRTSPPPASGSGRSRRRRPSRRRRRRRAAVAARAPGAPPCRSSRARRGTAGRPTGARRRTRAARSRTAAARRRADRRARPGPRRGSGRSDRRGSRAPPAPIARRAS